MILEELRREADERCGTPEGIQMLISAILRSLEEDLDTALEAIPSSEDDPKVTVDELADMFAEIQCRDVSVSEVRMSPRTFAKVFLNSMSIRFDRETRRVNLKQGILGYLWGASVIQDRNIPDWVFVLKSDPEFNVVQTFDFSKTRLERAYCDLLRAYVLAKRQKQVLNREHASQYYEGSAGNLAWSESNNRLNEKIRKAQDELKRLTMQIGRDRAHELDKQLGPTMSFGMFAHSQVQTEQRQHDTWGGMIETSNLWLDPND